LWEDTSLSFDWTDDGSQQAFVQLFCYKLFAVVSFELMAVIKNACEQQTIDARPLFSR
jgi:hypothetical protein